jgi:hypothetical protein
MGQHTDTTNERVRTMTRNESTADRLVRFVLGAAAVVWGAMIGWGTVGGIVLLAVGAILVVTALLGFCPLYRVLGISTARGEHATTGPRR